MAAAVEMLAAAAVVVVVVAVAVAAVGMAAAAVRRVRKLGGIVRRMGRIDAAAIVWFPIAFGRRRKKNARRWKRGGGLPGLNWCDSRVWVCR